MANVENIQKTIDTMRELGDKAYKFDMDTYVQPVEEDMRPTPECGTACCIGGFALIAKNGYIDLNQTGVAFEAAEFLGIEGSGLRLFSPLHSEAWGATLQEGIAVLEHLRDTGEVDWTVAFPGLEDL